MQQYSIVCAPSVVQYVALACPTVDSTENITSYRAYRYAPMTSMAEIYPDSHDKCQFNDCYPTG